MAQKIRKKRITKKEWYDRGGFANSALFRQQSRGKVYGVESYDDFTARVKADDLASVPLQEITAEFYDQMLCVLPPMYREGAMGFFMCEYTAGTITNQFVSRRTSDFAEPRYYVKAVDMTDRATWITPEMIDALPDAPRLAWFDKIEGEGEAEPCPISE